MTMATRFGCVSLTTFGFLRLMTSPVSLGPTQDREGTKRNFVLDVLSVTTRALLPEVPRSREVLKGRPRRGASSRPCGLPLPGARRHLLQFPIFRFHAEYLLTILSEKAEYHRRIGWTSKTSFPGATGRLRGRVQRPGPSGQATDPADSSFQRGLDDGRRDCGRFRPRLADDDAASPGSRGGGLAIARTKRA